MTNTETKEAQEAEARRLYAAEDKAKLEGNHQAAKAARAKLEALPLRARIDGIDLPYL